MNLNPFAICLFGAIVCLAIVFVWQAFFPPKGLAPSPGLDDELSWWEQQMRLNGHRPDEAVPEQIGPGFYDHAYSAAKRDALYDVHVQELSKDDAKKAYQREYQKKWHAKNRDKRIAQMKAWRAKKKAERLAGASGNASMALAAAAAYTPQMTKDDLVLQEAKRIVAAIKQKG